MSQRTPPLDLPAQRSMTSANPITGAHRTPKVFVPRARTAAQGLASGLMSRPVHHMSLDSTIWNASSSVSLLPLLFVLYSVSILDSTPFPAILCVVLCRLLSILRDLTLSIASVFLRGHFDFLYTIIYLELTLNVDPAVRHSCGCLSGNLDV